MQNFLGCTYLNIRKKGSLLCGIRSARLFFKGRLLASCSNMRPLATSKGRGGSRTAPTCTPNLASCPEGTQKLKEPKKIDLRVICSYD